MVLKWFSNFHPRSSTKEWKSQPFNRASFFTIPIFQLQEACLQLISCIIELNPDKFIIVIICWSLASSFNLSRHMQNIFTSGFLGVREEASHICLSLYILFLPHFMASSYHPTKFTFKGSLPEDFANQCHTFLWTWSF